MRGLPIPYESRFCKYGSCFEPYFPQYAQCPPTRRLLRRAKPRAAPAPPAKPWCVTPLTKRSSGCGQRSAKPMRASARCWSACWPMDCCAWKGWARLRATLSTCRVGNSLQRKAQPSCHPDRPIQPPNRSALCRTPAGLAPRIARALPLPIEQTPGQRANTCQGIAFQVGPRPGKAQAHAVVKAV